MITPPLYLHSRSKIIEVFNGSKKVMEDCQESKKRRTVGSFWEKRARYYTNSFQENQGLEMPYKNRLFWWEFLIMKKHSRQGLFKNRGPRQGRDRSN